MKRLVKKVLAHVVKKGKGAITTYKDPVRRKIFDLIDNINKENKFLMGYNEAYQLYMCVERTSKIPGDIAEVGTYMGSSAKLICEAKGMRNLYLFDTFEGLPDVQNVDEAHLKKGDFKSSYHFVKSYLSSYQNVFIIKGIFPVSADPVKNKSFSLVNLDVDIYQSTKDCLEFFYPRIIKGGIILSHDYITLAGVRKAFDEFYNDKPEIIIEMSGTQCLVVKL